MDNLDDSENNAKISDSAYSNSCSNSQSRKSHSSKSTHSGSHSSGSSGYGGKPSPAGYGTTLVPVIKDAKKKKQAKVETITAEVQGEAEIRSTDQPMPGSEAPIEEIKDVPQILSPALAEPDKGVENMEIVPLEKNKLDEVDSCSGVLVSSSLSLVNGQSPVVPNGFACVISMQDGIVIYTTNSITSSLGFPKHMWIGRSFIDFVHPRDRNTFASQITNGLAVPNVNGTVEKAPSLGNSVSTMVCRIRRYRSLSVSFGVKERNISYLPFLLKLSFKNISDEEGKVIYLVIQATQFFSAFKVPLEKVADAVPFVIRHSANGGMEYVDPKSVPYLGYIPQDMIEKDALQLYHPDDLSYLVQVYETIVREGGAPIGKPYRLLGQNGDYMRVETEWSSFINPWSRKLKFVIGKHHILEGPANPDVFHLPIPEKLIKLTLEETAKAKNLRDSIVRIMNEVPTKPAEAVKQQMSKRCQDVASFMESLIEDQPKLDEELRLEINDADHSCYIEDTFLHPRMKVAKDTVFQERDSVMLGGISPHHEYNDSKSSSDTPLSYNQLNYYDNLQRYFDSHQPFSYEDYNTVTGENVLDLKRPRSNCLSPMAQQSGDSHELLSSCESGGVLSGCGVLSGSSPMVTMHDFQPRRLTESLLYKHNTDMEKELAKVHRENRSSSKGDRNRVSNENRQKKKEHLARCNTNFQTTVGGPPVTPETQPHGVKRSSKAIENETGPHKHHCSSQRQSRRRQPTSTAAALPSSTITTTVAAATQWQNHPTSGVSRYMVPVPQQMPMISPMTTVPGVFPVYYTPTRGTVMPHNSQNPNQQNGQIQHPVHCMMYGQPVYGAPFMYTPVTPQISYPLQDNLMAQTLQFSNMMDYPKTTNKVPTDQKYAANSQTLRSKIHASLWRDKMRTDALSSKVHQGSAGSSISTNILNQNSEVVTDGTTTSDSKTKHRHNEDKTDGESSYSSFYSSFFKTDSGSAEESGDRKKTENSSKLNSVDNNYNKPAQPKKVPRRKMEPPWMEQVCVTSELIYKYQILTKSVEEVLAADKEKMKDMEQPSLVNQQLDQLYLDLQLEGVAARLTLEEGITSSSSSGEESPVVPRQKATKRKREYSKLVLIYEEETPLPPPDDEMVEPSASTSNA